MKVLWPSALFLLSLPLILTAIYIWTRKRRRRYALRYSSLSLIRAALPAQSRLRRYLPPALYLLALTSLVICLARPAAVTLVPAGRATIILALDVSGSMRQNDISPSRLAAAKEAALSFIDRQQDNNRIGIVAFAGIAQLVQYPTTDVEELTLAIQNLTTGRGTAIGSGILTGLETIVEFNQNVTGSGEAAPSESTLAPGSVAEGAYIPDIIVLLTDGVYTTGPHPLDAAQQAVERGVRVYTIGYGTHRNAEQEETDYWGRGGRFRGIDEEMLKEIAAMTGGDYYTATSASELQDVFDNLPTMLSAREETMEISVLFAAIGALLIIAAVILSQLWHPLP